MPNLYNPVPDGMPIVSGACASCGCIARHVEVRSTLIDPALAKVCRTCHELCQRCITHGLIEPHLCEWPHRARIELLTKQGGERS